MSQWIPSVVMLLVSLISYIDRNTLALLAPTILRETGLTVEQYGRIVSAFSFAYMIGNPVWGRILDRVGLRVGMAASVSFWTLSSVAHAFAGGFTGFAVARAALGFGEGATFPGGLRAAVQSLPARLQGRGMAISYSGGSLGAILTPIVVTPVAAHWGWRGAFWFTGLIGLCWLLVWAFTSRRADMRVIPKRDSVTARIPWRDRRVWGFMAAYALGGFPIAFVLYQSAIYLTRVMGKTQQEVGVVLWIPPLGWELGYFIWGWITDRVLKDSRNRLRAYGRLMGVAAAASLLLALAPRVESYPLLLAQLFFAMFAAAGFIIPPIRYATDVLSAGNAGLIAGLGAGSWGALVAIAMPWMGRLFDLEIYGGAFGITACFPAIGLALWWMASRRDGVLDARG
jgi:ACS family hexuronate transporter-like MFS transporter